MYNKAIVKILWLSFRRLFLVVVVQKRKSRSGVFPIVKGDSKRIALCQTCLKLWSTRSKMVLSYRKCFKYLESLHFSTFLMLVFPARTEMDFASCERIAFWGTIVSVAAMSFISASRLQEWGINLGMDRYENFQPILISDISPLLWPIFSDI